MNQTSNLSDHKYWYLRSHKLFEQLDSSEVEQLCIISNMKNSKKNDVIDFSEQESRFIYIVKHGIVKICTEDENGKEIISEMLSDNDLFGALHDVNAKTGKQYYAKALTDEVRLCYFEVDNFKKVLSSNIEVQMKFGEIMNEKMISFQQKYEDLIFKDVDMRLTEFFRRYANHHGKDKEGTMEMEMVLTHQEIADYIAASRQTVTMIINKLVDSGKVIYEGRRKVFIPKFSEF